MEDNGCNTATEASTVGICRTRARSSACVEGSLNSGSVGLNWCSGLGGEGLVPRHAVFLASNNNDLKSPDLKRPTKGKSPHHLTCQCLSGLPHPSMETEASSYAMVLESLDLGRKATLADPGGIRVVPVPS